MLGLENFQFIEIWRPTGIIISLVVAIAYLILTGPKRTMFKESSPVSTNKKVMFLIGVAIVYITQGGPLSLLEHLMFSAHMASMSLAFLVAVPLILLGIPDWMVKPLLSNPFGGRIMGVLTHPMAGVLAFNIAFSFYHMPAIHDYVMTNFVVHRIYFAALFVTAFMMWWTIVSPVPDWRPISELKKMAYIFANGVLITPACALIIFADTPIFATYSDPQLWAVAMGYCLPAESAAFLLENFGGPEHFTYFSAQEDQQLGGVIMKLMQELLYGAAVAYTFFKWYTRERKEDDLEPNPVV